MKNFKIIPICEEDVFSINRLIEKENMKLYPDIGNVINLTDEELTSLLSNTSTKTGTYVQPVYANNSKYTQRDANIIFNVLDFSFNIGRERNNFVKQLLSGVSFVQHVQLPTGDVLSINNTDGKLSVSSSMDGKCDKLNKKINSYISSLSENSMTL